MPFLKGGFADLTKFRLGKFTVDGLTARDNRGIPRWFVSCPYGHTQVLGHLRLAALVESKAANNLQCKDAGCPLSKSRTQSETLAEFLKRERRAAEERAKAESERLAQAQAEWAKEQEKEVELDRLRTQFREFWLHQTNTSLPESEIPTLKQWCGFSDSARQQILEACRKDPSAEWRFKNL